MTAILNRFKKRCVSAYAADILWRTSSTALDADRVANASLLVHALLDDHFVLPPVSEIINVLELKREVWRDLRELYSAFIYEIRAFLRRGLPEAEVADSELVKMIVLPSHHDLQHFMKFE